MLHHAIIVTKRMNANKHILSKKEGGKMKLFTLNCEVIVPVHADNIDEAEEQVKNRFNATNIKFRQLLEYTTSTL